MLGEGKLEKNRWSQQLLEESPIWFQPGLSSEEPEAGLSSQLPKPALLFLRDLGVAAIDHSTQSMGIQPLKTSGVKRHKRSAALAEGER